MLKKTRRRSFAALSPVDTEVPFGRNSHVRTAPSAAACTCGSAWAGVHRHAHVRRGGGRRRRRAPLGEPLSESGELWGQSPARHHRRPPWSGHSLHEREARVHSVLFAQHPGLRSHPTPITFSTRAHRHPTATLPERGHRPKAPHSGRLRPYWFLKGLVKKLPETCEKKGWRVLWETACCMCVTPTLGALAPPHPLPPILCALWFYFALGFSILSLCVQFALLFCSG